MIPPALRGPQACTLTAAAVLVLLIWTGAWADVRGQVTVDLDSGEVLSAAGAGTPTRPASLAKIMTLFMLLEALAAGSLEPDTPLAVSTTAAGQPPTRLGLRAGDQILARRAALALLVRSANDVAVVVAEALAGSEKAFAARMNAKAAVLGLGHTVFGNASGLPHPAARTNARDMAALARALYARFPEYADLFATTAFTRGSTQHRSHNSLLVSYPGAIGLKTGFTCRAGYHTVTVAARHGRRVVAVVLGAPSPGARDASARLALDRALQAAPHSGPTLGPLASFRPASGKTLNASSIAQACGSGASGRDPYMRAFRWSVELEPFASRRAALNRARQVQRLAAGARPLLLPDLAQRRAHRAGITDLTRARAIAVCRQLRARQRYCIVRRPEYIAQLKMYARLYARGGQLRQQQGKR